MPAYRDVLATIPEPDVEAGRQCQGLLDMKTKPQGSLGRLEELACQWAALRGEPAPAMPRKGLVVMAADHGVTEERVSAYPAEVTAQMVANFARGGAAINVLARQHGVRVEVVDMGVRVPVEGLEGVRVHRQGPGTANLARGPAMSRKTAEEALSVGALLALELADSGVTLLGLGDMGIGNTTASAALTCVLAGVSPDMATGRGTGVDDEGLSRKVDVVRRALAVNQPDAADPLDVLAKVGGFEIAGLAGAALGAASRRVPVMLDGFISSVAGLVAARLCPKVMPFLLASHMSREAGHRRVLEALRLRPLLDLGLRLGEGTGAVLAMGLMDSSMHVLHEMATFASAGVAEKTRR
ncbi:nicotinate-nucleotide--dimethylbenzimidazole phosphoribosyltransferase [Myxococcus qinghaiensis]|uniref:nicotinate-nucleotide--dimethylbenzimidazole phosphoribosyltransferase n=1 Tax=Myxococcus qinghaiensis TaxID=2906758 RepID=UPI0020A6EA39|nr:nicotinate-nucleotide--dimethylbenzimidazole phosphoribosyltransferase [Myxococcus qinghaiensis]MCP3164988.1 nicotinate-nucleotide--dimethylbenzimidazole phosphoribosyltransferase [Myxococcus qinghaiensis]